MNRKDNYIDEFVEAQEQQYVQNTFHSKNEPIPLLKARGKAFPFAVFLLFQSGLFYLEPCCPIYQHIRSSPSLP